MSEDIDYAHLAQQKQKHVQVLSEVRRALMSVSDDILLSIREIGEVESVANNSAELQLTLRNSVDGGVILLQTYED